MTNVSGAPSQNHPALKTGRSSNERSQKRRTATQQEIQSSVKDIGEIVEKRTTAHKPVCLNKSDSIQGSSLGLNKIHIHFG